MKNGKCPTVAQRKLMKQCGLNSDDWLVIKNEQTQMIIVHRISGQQKTIPKDSK